MLSPSVCGKDGQFEKLIRERTIKGLFNGPLSTICKTNMQYDTFNALQNVKGYKIVIKCN